MGVRVILGKFIAREREKDKICGMEVRVILGKVAFIAREREREREKKTKFAGWGSNSSTSLSFFSVYTPIKNIASETETNACKIQTYQQVL